MRYWNLVVQETTTFTLPNPDEYERPEEIREVEVNRVKARSVAVEGDALSFGDKLRASLLGQLHEAIADWEDRDLRRSFVHMQVACNAIFAVKLTLRIVAIVTGRTARMRMFRFGVLGKLNSPAIVPLNLRCHDK